MFCMIKTQQTECLKSTILSINYQKENETNLNKFMITYSIRQPYVIQERNLNLSRPRQKHQIKYEQDTKQLFKILVS